MDPANLGVPLGHLCCLCLLETEQRPSDTADISYSFNNAAGAFGFFCSRVCFDSTQLHGNSTQFKNPLKAWLLLAAGSVLT